MNDRDEVRLRDMLDAAHDAMQFIEGRAREALDADRLLAYGLVRAIEVIGEAASQVSDETRDLHPEVPWRSIVATRHRIVHDYRNVDLDIVWEIATARLPQLVSQLEQILPPEEGRPSED